MVPEDRSYFGEMACHRARCRCCLAIDDTLCVSHGRFYEAACLWFRDPDVSERTWHDSYIGSWPNCWLRAFSGGAPGVYSSPLLMVASLYLLLCLRSSKHL